MLLQESLWFKNIIRNDIENGSSILNIGSSTDEFIKEKQPYIYENVFLELQKKGASIKNVDIKAAPGVDYVGDVTNKEFIKLLRELKPDVIICSNLLEHLEERQFFCEALIDIMGPNTLLIVSVPYEFPYHPDPIDTMYRPTVTDIVNQFNLLTPIDVKKVNCGRYISFEMNYNRFNLWEKLKFMKLIISFGIRGFLKKDQDKIGTFLKYFSRISATCATFKKVN